MKVKKAVIESVDFSFADISYSYWQDCRFSNCLFQETKGKEINVIASDFEKCVFQKADFSYSYMNENIGVDSGAYKSCLFEQTNLSECIFRFPIVKNCIFRDCNLKATNFDGSRMEDCQFIGKVDSTWFRGYSITARKSILGIFNRVDPQNYPNKMGNVDFSNAVLTGVSFTHGVDLSKCVFPNSDQYIIINDLHHTMNTVRNVIELEWEGEDKRKGLALIDHAYLRKEKHGQVNDVIDTFPIPYSSVEFDNKFFDLIRANNK